MRTFACETSHDRGADGDVSAAVQEIGGLPVEASGPGNRDGHEPQGRTSPFVGDRLGEFDRLVDGRKVAMSDEGREISEEQGISTGDPPDERL
jgi:hypothetical protein